MKYKKFIIQGYRGISDITEINISKESLIPIIGKNESGKTTCLEAILAFDYTNDEEYGGKHLSNVINLYSTEEPPVIVSAEIVPNNTFKLGNLLKKEIAAFESAFSAAHPDEKLNLKKISFDLDVDDENDYRLENWEYIRAYQLLTEDLELSNSLRIDRDLKTTKYSIPKLSKHISSEVDDLISRKFVNSLPYTLYFDDFRDRLEEKIYITNDIKSGNYSPWITYIDEIFKRTKEGYSIYDLPTRNDGIRRSIIREVQNKLNKTLIEEWSNYQFDKREDIIVQIDYQDNSGSPYLQLKIIEKVVIDNVEQERFFDISDRSKGFYWYLNFMIKLHFNTTKRDLNDKDTIYLLDEPGSYLHPYALTQLAKQLHNLSINNNVIYCTHSHNLLNPDYIPINSIRLAEKNNKGKIVLKHLDHKGIIRPKKNSAYQSVFDALEVKPPMLEFELNDIVLLEGIYDYYSFKMFTSSDLNYFPCVSASSIVNQIPYMIFLGKKYLAVWDNDKEGRERLKKASDCFGEYESTKFMTLIPKGGSKDTKLEDYFDKEELSNFTSSPNHNKEGLYKFILDLYYDKNRKKIIDKNFSITKGNFQNLEKIFLEKLGKAS